MPLFAVSDLHLGDAGRARMFRDDAQGERLAALCDQVAATGNAELFLLGDVFDVTAAVPPAKGLAEFSKALGFDVPPPVARSVRDILGSIRETNPRALEALERLSRVAPVTLVPGNHDRHLGEEGGRQALDSIGLSAVRIEPQAVRRLGDQVVVLQHGHAWDPSNATPAGGGETMTAVLHHAVIPFLRHLAPRSNVRIEPERVVSLRPEERVVPVLERWLKPGAFETFLDAFLELLVENGYLSRAAAWLATPSVIRARLREDDDLWERSGHAALEALEGARPIPGRPPPPDVLVLGHTHVLDWAVQEGRPGVQRLYVNLGTWSARASDAAGPVDATLPVLRVDLGSRTLDATLWDFGARTGPDRAPLQHFEVNR